MQFSGTRCRDQPSRKALTTWEQLEKVRTDIKNLATLKPVMDPVNLIQKGPRPLLTSDDAGVLLFDIAAIHARSAAKRVLQ